MVGNVQGYHLDAALRLRYRFLVGIATAELKLNFGRLIAEHRLEQPVQRFGALDLQLRQPCLVEDWHRCTVRHGLRNRVGVDEGAETPHRVSPEVLIYRRAGEAHENGVGQGPGHAPTENAVLRAVGLIDHDDDILRGIEDFELSSGEGNRILKLLNRRHDRTARSGGEETSQVSARCCLLRSRETASLESV